MMVMMIHHTQMGKKLLGQNENLLPNKKQNQHPIQEDMYDKNSYAKRTDTLYISIKQV